MPSPFPAWEIDILFILGDRYPLYLLFTCSTSSYTSHLQARSMSLLVTSNSLFLPLTKKPEFTQCIPLSCNKTIKISQTHNNNKTNTRIPLHIVQVSQNQTSKTSGKEESIMKTSSNKETIILGEDPEFKSAFADYIEAMEVEYHKRTKYKTQFAKRKNDTVIKQRYMLKKRDTWSKDAKKNVVEVKVDRETWSEVVDDSIKFNRKRPSSFFLSPRDPDEEEEEDEIEEEEEHEAFLYLKHPTAAQVSIESKVELLAKRLNRPGKMTSWRFHKLMCDSRMKFTDYSVHCLVQILGKMGNWRRVLQLIDWIQRGERYKSYNAKYMYTTVLSILGRAERAKQALEVFQAMRKDFSSYPDMASYHVIAVILGRAGYIRELVDIMDSLRNGPDRDILTLPLKNWDPCLYPDVIVYNALINACVQQKEWKGAEWVLKKMYQDGTKPDITSYGLVMEAMMAAGKFDMVEYYFAKMQNLGFVPDVLTYKVIVQASCKEGKVDKAIQAVSEMENKGIVGTAGLYYELARGLCSLGRYNEALLQIDRIKKVGKKPIYVAYTGLIQASMDHGYLENAIYIFNHLQNVCVPNIYTINLMLKLYANNDMFKDVKLLYQNIRSGTINPKVIPNGIDNTTVKADFNTFITVLKACAAAKDWDYFENVYWDMIVEGISPDNTSLIKLIVAACRAGKGQLLESVYVKLAQAGAAPHVSVYKELVFHNIASRNYLHACEYLHRMARKERLNTTKGEWIQFLNRSNYEIQKENLQGLIETGQSFKAANETVARFDDFMNSFRILAEQYV